MIEKHSSFGNVGSYMLSAPSAALRHYQSIGSSMDRVDMMDDRHFASSVALNIPTNVGCSRGANDRVFQSVPFYRLSTLELR